MRTPGMEQDLELSSKCAPIPKPPLQVQHHQLKTSIHDTHLSLTCPGTTILPDTWTKLLGIITVFVPSIAKQQQNLTSSCSVFLMQAPSVPCLVLAHLDYWNRLLASGFFLLRPKPQTTTLYLVLLRSLYWFHKAMGESLSSSAYNPQNLSKSGPVSLPAHLCDYSASPKCPVHSCFCAFTHHNTLI